MSKFSKKSLLGFLLISSVFLNLSSCKSNQKDPIDEAIEKRNKDLIISEKDLISQKEELEGVIMSSEYSDIFELEKENGDKVALKSDKFHLENYEGFLVSIQGTKEKNNNNEKIINVELIDIISTNPDKKSKEEEKEDTKESKFKTYSNQDGDINFIYPSSWKIEEADGFINLKNNDEIVSKINILEKPETETIFNFIAKKADANQSLVNIKVGELEGARINEKDSEETSIFIETEKTKVISFMFFPNKNLSSLENQILKNNFYEMVDSFSKKEIVLENEDDQKEENNSSLELTQKKVSEKIENKISNLVPESALSNNWKISQISFAGDKYTYVEVFSGEENREVLFEYSLTDDAVFLKRKAYFKVENGKEILISGSDTAKNLEKEVYKDFDRSITSEKEEDSKTNKIDNEEEVVSKTLEVDLNSEKTLGEDFENLGMPRGGYSIGFPKNLYWRRFASTAPGYINFTAFGKEEVELGNQEFSVGIIKGEEKQDSEFPIQIYVKRDESTSFIFEGKPGYLETLEKMAKTIKLD